jgi:hypothetical protein
MRRAGARVEDERGTPVSFFQLKEMAELEARKRGEPHTKPDVLKDEIEGLPSQHERFRVRRDAPEATSSPRSTRWKQPLPMFGADAPIGATLSTIVARSFGALGESKLEELLDANGSTRVREGLAQRHGRLPSEASAPGGKSRSTIRYALTMPRLWRQTRARTL